jgi:diguanylate cyclase (GGDEF)-like protein
MSGLSVLPAFLDLHTMFVADISVTAVLGLMLMFAWLQSRSSEALGWWGIAHLCQCVGLVLLVGADMTYSVAMIKFAATLMLASYGVMWLAVRRFDGRHLHPLIASAGAMAWAFFAAVEISKAPLHYFMLYSLINGGYCLMIALEFWRGRAEPLVSRWPAIVLLVVSSAGFFSWVPLVALVPSAYAGPLLPGPWFATVILITVLGKVALAFIVLAMAKERLELHQRVEAMTDALTGLPNRRGFYRQAMRRLRERRPAARPAAVLLFDLDHFKRINDRFGHGVGDRVLMVFADILTNSLKATDIIGRVGGEEFAVLLDDADQETGCAVAERVRATFEADGAVIADGRVAPTVSVGVAAVSPAAFSLQEMIGFADSALYQSKASGRNRVRTIEQPDGSAEGNAVIVEAPPLKPVLVKPSRSKASRAAY